MITEQKLTREDVKRIIREARATGKRIELAGRDLYGLDLSGLDLHGANLYYANLHSADLRSANLHSADLRYANLYYADLRGADLHSANLYATDLYGADLYGADLHSANLYATDLYGADLYGADLRYANLYYADLWGANLWGATGGLFAIHGLPSGDAILVPTPDGWALRVGRRGDGTAAYGPGEFRTLAMSDNDEDWPDARGSEIADRRPLLLLLADLCDDHIRRHASVIAELAEKWPPDATDNDRD